MRNINILTNSQLRTQINIKYIVKIILCWQHDVVYIDCLPTNEKKKKRTVSFLYPNFIIYIIIIYLRENLNESNRVTYDVCVCVCVYLLLIIRHRSIVSLRRPKHGMSHEVTWLPAAVYRLRITCIIIT